MMPKEAKELLIALQHERSIEYAHVRADRILCDLLEALGYEDVVEEYRLIDKWYA